MKKKPKPKPASRGEQREEKGAQGKPGRAPGLRGSWPLLIVLVVLLLWIWRGASGFGGAGTLAYSDFKERLARGEVVSLVLGETEIAGKLRPAPPPEGEEAPSREAEPEPTGAEDEQAPRVQPPPGAEVAEPGQEAELPEPGPDGLIPFRTVRVDDPELVEQLQAGGVEYTGKVESAWGQLLWIWLLPLMLMFLLFGGIFRSAAGRMGTQLTGFGKSRARLAPEQGTGVTFDDVAGCDEAKHELRQMVEFLRNPGRFTALGARIPKGVLLLGPPGTGKTLMARAVAGEAGVPFFSISGSDFVEMFVGVGAARVRDLFVEAKAKAPCIVFIDEIDAVGRQRGVTMGVVNDEREQTLNQLLAEMDGFEVNSGVIILAATNRPEVLDRALLRPGRFDRQVVLDAPDQRGRLAILQVHARGKPIASDVELERIARATPGMSGADLSNAINEAALTAAQEGREQIHQGDLEEAIEKVVAGPERRSRRLGESEKRRVAYHESGHALVAAHCEHADPVQKISIVPRGRAALGYTLQLPAEEQYLRTRAELLDRIKVMVGGRASEELCLGEVSTGAHDDLQQATGLARHMVGLFGMSERIGLATCARPSENRFLGGDGALQRDCSEATAREIDEEVKALLDAAYSEAKAILKDHREQLETLVSTLLERETMDQAAFMQLIESTGARANGRERTPRRG